MARNSTHSTEESQENSHKGKRHGRHHTYVGVFIVIIGCLFLLDNFGYLPHDMWSKYWPIVIIILGLMRIFRSHKE